MLANSVRLLYLAALGEAGSSLTAAKVGDNIHNLVSPRCHFSSAADHLKKAVS
jgi:hypothetical protein